MRTILSVCDTEFKANRAYSLTPTGPFNANFVLAANKKGEFSTCRVADMYQHTHIHDGMYHGAPDSDTNIANDVIGEWTLNSNVPPPGILLCAGDVPTEDEKAQARAIHNVHCEALRNEAFNLWAENKRKEAAMPRYRNASIYLDHPEDPWVMAQEPSKDKKCPVCRKDVPFDALKCSYCNSVVDFEGMANYELKLQQAMDRVKPVQPPPVPQIPVPSKPQARA